MNTKTTTHGDMLRAHADIADYSSRGDFTAQYLRDAAGIIDAQAEEIEHLKRDLDNIRYVLEDYGKHTNRAQSTLSPSGLGKNYLHAALDQLDQSKARVVALERELAEARKLEAVCHCGVPLRDHETENHGAVEMEHPCPNADRVAELDEALERISQLSYYDGADFCHPEGCVAPRIARAVLAKWSAE